jgi:serine acetyltransferase/GT2 family glycosyltransferase
MSAPALPHLSVIVATYNRPALLSRLLAQLERQTLPAGHFEVVVVDDGSRTPAADTLGALTPRYALRVERQANAGAAAARHRGALLARGRVLVIIDDDMQVEPDFLAQHLALHEGNPKRAVLGRIRGDPQLQQMPLFERWYQRMLDTLAEDAAAGRLQLHGGHLYTGNVSLRREDYVAVGGFDCSLGHSEDSELGLRLEKAGVELVFSEQAFTLHGSDHTSLEKWRQRARRYGAFDHRIGRKHADLPHANPWRFLFELNPLSRPLMAATVVAPRAGAPVARAAYALSSVLDRLRLERAALAGTTFAYGLEYFSGLRTEVGPLSRAVEEAAECARSQPAVAPGSLLGRLALLPRLAREVLTDRETMVRYQGKYGRPEERGGSLASDLLQKVGLQMMGGYRVMRTLRDGQLPLAARAVSRVMRHAYGSDVHWDAELAPGVVIIHGMGMAISHSARVGPGCILMHHVTLAYSTDPVTGEHGAPTLEANVHVGPGATLIGPITVGEGSKIMAGAVLTHSVPPRSVVEAPAPTVRARAPARNGSAKRSLRPLS